MEEQLGALLAAAIHDYDHPGKTNAFLSWNFLFKFSQKQFINVFFI
jgi:hypothetical protein